MGLFDFITRWFKPRPQPPCNDRCVNGIYWRFEWQNGRCMAVEAMRVCKPGDEGYNEADTRVASSKPLPKKPGESGDDTGTTV